jgi:hypothetical protein
MPPYCLPEDVKELIFTELNDQEIISIIKDADGDLDDKLQGATMNDFNKRQCSRRLAAVTIAQKQRTEIKYDVNNYQKNSFDNNVKEWLQYVDDKVSRAYTKWNTIDPKTRPGKIFTRRRHKDRYY